MYRTLPGIGQREFGVERKKLVRLLAEPVTSRNIVPQALRKTFFVSLTSNRAELMPSLPTALIILLSFV